MRMAVIVFLALALGGTAGWWLLKVREARGLAAFPAVHPVLPPSIDRVIEPRASSKMEDAGQRAGSSAVAQGSSVRRVFRLVFENGRCSLEAVEEVRGDFRPARQEMWAPGMLCCRLLDAKNHVLAEEVVRAPDQICVVLDPNTSADATPEPAQLTPRGPVVFQVRMPAVENAVLLKIYRLEGSERAALHTDPVGMLVATIPLANR